MSSVTPAAPQPLVDVTPAGSNSQVTVTERLEPASAAAAVAPRDRRSRRGACVVGQRDRGAERDEDEGEEARDGHAWLAADRAAIPRTNPPAAAVASRSAARTSKPVSGPRSGRPTISAPTGSASRRVSCGTRRAVAAGSAARAGFDGAAFGLRHRRLPGRTGRPARRVQRASWGRRAWSAVPSGRRSWSPPAARAAATPLQWTARARPRMAAWPRRRAHPASEPAPLRGSSRSSAPRGEPARRSCRRPSRRRRVVGHGERRAACGTGVTGDDERSQA